MVGRIERSADFERVLALVPRARSSHFALHHLPAAPSRPAWVVKARNSVDSSQLSTRTDPDQSAPVDDSLRPAPVPSVVEGHWLGLVVPKRHARRAVTRTLIKRQARAMMQVAAASLPPGLWVLRLKAPFDPKLFPSAASEPLRCAAREELGRLFERALQAPARTPRPPAEPARRPAVVADAAAVPLAESAGRTAVGSTPLTGPR